MRELVMKHHVVTEIDESQPPPPLWQQGDWSMYTDENLAIREQLAKHPGIVKILDKVCVGGASGIGFMTLFLALYNDSGGKWRRIITSAIM